MDSTKAVIAALFLLAAPAFAETTNILRSPAVIDYTTQVLAWREAGRSGNTIGRQLIHYQAFTQTVVNRLVASMHENGSNVINEWSSITRDGEMLPIFKSELPDGTPMLLETFLNQRVATPPFSAALLNRSTNAEASALIAVPRAALTPAEWVPSKGPPLPLPAKSQIEK